MKLNKEDKAALDSSGWEHFFQERRLAECIGLGFDLTFSEFLKVALSKCYFCKLPGKTPITTKQKRNQLDRKERLRHFTTENTIAVCRFCYKARRAVHPKMVWHVVQVNRKLGLINSSNRFKEAKKK